MAEKHAKSAVINVGSQRIARTYAEALLNAAGKQGQTDAVLDELDSLVYDLFPAQPLLSDFLVSSAIGRDHKQKLLQSVFGSRATPLFADFLQVLNANDRLELLAAILTEARALYDKRAHRVRVFVRTAVPLPDDQRQRLMGGLQETLKGQPILEEQVDPGLLGGIMVRVGDWLFDASVRTRLEIIRKQILEKGSHEIQSQRDCFCSAAGN